MIGKIVKGIAGFYYVHTPENVVYECKAKGVFRNKKIKPLVGDNVEIEVLDKAAQTGNIIKVLERKNQLIRPAVANVDQAVIIFAGAKPDPNFNMLDRFLIMMQKQGVPCSICFNKRDIIELEKEQELREMYEKCGYPVIFTSTVTEEGMDVFHALLENKTTVLAGPSGVGKSSIINKVKPEANMETGDISRKIERGKHTTRHSELFHVSGNSYIMDTPGFTSLYIEGIEYQELKDYFTEFKQYEPYCKFNGCVHVNEPQCGVKAVLEEEKISRSRYNNYVALYEELKQQRKY